MDLCPKCGKYCTCEGDKVPEFPKKGINYWWGRDPWDSAPVCRFCKRAYCRGTCRVRDPHHPERG